MSDINTGGPMFPAPVTKPLENYYPGISIRDYFAAKALQGMLAENGGGALANDKLADYAYNIADEMLRAREAT
jgi:hypothetical protein